MLVPGADLNPPVVGNSEIGSGALTFTTDGALNAETVTTAVTASFGGGATAAQAITLDFGTSVAEGGTGLDGTDAIRWSVERVFRRSKTAMHRVISPGVSVDGQGVVTGLYTNGQKIAMSQLGIAKFRSNDGLGRAGQNLWIATRESGTAAMGNCR